MELDLTMFWQKMMIQVQCRQVIAGGGIGLAVGIALIWINFLPWII